MPSVPFKKLMPNQKAQIVLDQMGLVALGECGEVLNYRSGTLRVGNTCEWCGAIHARRILSTVNLLGFAPRLIQFS